MLEPAAYMYQHDETGRTTFRESDDRMNEPRWHEFPLYREWPVPPVGEPFDPEATVGELAKHVGAWETPEGVVCFGSWMAVAAFRLHIIAGVAQQWAQMEGARKEIADNSLRTERDELRDVLLRNGFAQSASAHNYGAWHHCYGLPQRFEEIKEALAEAGHPLTNENGNLAIRALGELVQGRDELRDALDRLTSLADGFSVSGVYFNEFRENHEALAAAVAALNRVTFARTTGEQA